MDAFLGAQPIAKTGDLGVEGRAPEVVVAGDEDDGQARAVALAEKANGGRGAEAAGDVAGAEDGVGAQVNGDVVRGAGRAAVVVVDVAEDMGSHWRGAFRARPGGGIGRVGYVVFISCGWCRAMKD